MLSRFQILIWLLNLPEQAILDIKELKPPIIEFHAYKKHSSSPEPLEIEWKLTYEEGWGGGGAGSISINRFATKLFQKRDVKLVKSAVCKNFEIFFHEKLVFFRVKP